MAKKKQATQTNMLEVISYEPEKHCKSVKEMVGKEGSIYGFCTKAGISDTTFWRWCAIHEAFNDSYRQGLVKARYEWQKDGELNKDDDSFNMIYWKEIGQIKFATHKADKVRLDIDPNESPHIQYMQMIKQANRGDFTSTEFKQLMEAINIGVRAYEVFKQQEEIDKLREDFNKMSANNGQLDNATN